MEGRDNENNVERVTADIHISGHSVIIQQSPKLFHSPFAQP